MLNVEKQIEYWKNTGLSDFESAEILIDKGRYLHGLFFCHLAVEKLLKAHYVKSTENAAPKTHNLIYLVDKLDLTLSREQSIFLGLLMKYQLEGRYPEHNIVMPSKEECNLHLSKTKELLEWLTQKL